MIMTFNPSDHLMQIKSKQGSSDYLPVQWRLVWFREQCPQGTIDTEELEYDTERECSVEAFVWNPDKKRSEKIIKMAKGYARYRAVVTDRKGGRAAGTKAECRASFEDYGEKAETGAIGRALAGLGFGTQFAPELDEEHRLVDAPVERTQTSSQPASNDKSNVTQMPVKPSEVEQVKGFVGRVFGFSQDDFETRWAAYKVYRIGKPKADPDLTRDDINVLRNYAVEQENKIAVAAK